MFKIQNLKQSLFDYLEIGNWNLIENWDFEFGI